MKRTFMGPEQHTNYELLVVSSPGDWNAYHRIRREELFEARGRYGIYNPYHPDEGSRNHFPLLLKYNGAAVATARLDVQDDSVAILRFVAVTRSEQFKGHDRA